MFSKVLDRLLIASFFFVVIFGPLLLVYLCGKYELIMELTFLAACMWAAFGLVIRLKDILKEVIGIRWCRLDIKKPMQALGSFVSRNEILFHKKHSTKAFFLALPFPIARHILSPKRKRTAKVEAFLGTKEEKNSELFLKDVEVPTPSPGTKIEIAEND